MARAVHHGTHIEGNELNFTQAEKVMMGQDVVARPRDIQEVINYRRVMEFVEQSEKVVTEAFVKKMHAMTVDRILPDERCGVYRTTQVVVKNSLTGDVSFRPPAAVAVPFQVQQLITFLVKTSPEVMHPVLKSAVVHYELVRIHPFIDGNGRVARALSTYILFQEGYDIRKFFSLEEYFDRDASRYYQALQSVEKHDGNVTEWLEYFTQGLAVELTKIKDKIEKISVDGKLKARLGGAPLLLSDRQIQIVEYIQQTGHLQNQGFKSLFPMVSEDTVLNELKGLVKAGILRKSGKTKGAKYIMA